MNEIERRREHVIARRDEGWSYKRIGEELGISGVQVGRLYKLGIQDRERRAAEAARAAATPGTLIKTLGLGDDVTAALHHFGCSDVLSVLTQDWATLEARALRYPHVTRRALRPLLAIRERFERAARLEYDRDLTQRLEVVEMISGDSAANGRDAPHFNCV